jgi:hypothetical protein
MAAQTGKTHKKFTEFWLDNSAGTLTNLSSDVKAIGAVGLQGETIDITAYSDRVHNFLTGWPTAQIKVTFYWSTTVITHLSALTEYVPLTLDVRYGVRQSWVSGEPQFGITSDSTHGYICTGFQETGSETIDATFDVYGGTAPAWGTTAEA